MGGKKGKKCGAKTKSNGICDAGAGSSKVSGCICPSGCILGACIPAGATTLPEGCAKLECNAAGGCTGVPYVHKPCMDQFEQMLLATLRRRASSVAAQHADAVLLSQLWRQDYDKWLHDMLKCKVDQCKGFVRRDVQWEVDRQARNDALKPRFTPASHQQPARRTRGDNLGGGDTKLSRDNCTKNADATVNCNGGDKENHMTLKKIGASLRQAEQKENPQPAAANPLGDRNSNSRGVYNDIGQSSSSSDILEESEKSNEANSKGITWKKFDLEPLSCALDESSKTRGNESRQRSAGDIGTAPTEEPSSSVPGPFDGGFGVPYQAPPPSAVPADVNDVDEYPPISAEVWQQVSPKRSSRQSARAETADSRAQSQLERRTTASASSWGSQKLVTPPVVSVLPGVNVASVYYSQALETVGTAPRELTRVEKDTLSSIEMLVQQSSNGRLWKEEPRLLQLLNHDGLVETFMQTPFEQWLTEVSDMHVINNSVVFKSSGLIETTCKVDKIYVADPRWDPPAYHMSNGGQLRTTSSPILWIEFNTRGCSSVVCSNGASDRERHESCYFGVGDFVKVTAEKLPEPRDGCTHMATKMELLQRELVTPRTNSRYSESSISVGHETMRTHPHTSFNCQPGVAGANSRSHHVSGSSSNYALPPPPPIFAAVDAARLPSPPSEPRANCVSSRGDGPPAAGCSVDADNLSSASASQHDSSPSMAVPGARSPQSPVSNTSDNVTLSHAQLAPYQPLFLARSRGGLSARGSGRGLRRYNSDAVQSQYGAAGYGYFGAAGAAPTTSRMPLPPPQPPVYDVFPVAHTPSLTPTQTYPRVQRQPPKMPSLADFNIAD